MSESLRPSAAGRLCQGPVVLVIMDGVALGPEAQDNAVWRAHTPTLDGLTQGALSTQLLAHGEAVGMPSDGDMGNSEVGHNALGAGRIFAQGAKLVEDALHSGRAFEGEVWGRFVEACLSGGALHLIGLLSDGNVHSHERHLHRLLRQAHEAGVTRCFVHVLTDGRDVPERSALEYVERLEALLAELSTSDAHRYAIASGGGRMRVTMDRYEADWPMVERGWKAHVHGDARPFPSATQAIETYRQELGVNDQYLPAFAITGEDGQPVGPIVDGDAVLLFNFRGDRAMELCRAFEDDAFPHFDRGRRPAVTFAGMMQYDGDLQIPSQYLVAPPSIDRPLSAYLVAAGIRQYAISETQKYGHVTYFWNGNRSGKFDEGLETYVEVPSDPRPFEHRPWMQAAELTDLLLEAIESGQYDFLRINYPNGDMVGHTGSLAATIQAVATVDLCLARLLQAVERAKGVALVTADHGNADEMYERDKRGQLKRDAQGRPQPKTSHSLRPVPFCVFAPSLDGLELQPQQPARLSNVAATILSFLGFDPPDDYDGSLIRPLST